MNYTIMLVEDEPPILYAMKHLIETGNYGFTVITTARNGRDALKALETHVPDIIITDIQMPFINGLDLIEEVHRSFPEIKCVILTGHSDFEYARKALRTNAYEYLLKPIQVDQLRELLESLRKTLYTNQSQVELSALSNAIFFEETPQLSRTVFVGRLLVPLIICAGHFAQESGYSEHPGKTFWNQSEHQAVIQQYAETPGIWVLNGFTANEKIIVMSLETAADLAMNAFTSKLMQELCNAHIPLQIAYGVPVEQLDELPKKLKNLRAGLAKKVIFGASGIFAEDKTTSKVPFVVPNDYEKRFEFLTQHKSLAGFKKEFLLLLEEWELNQFSQAVVEALLLTLTNKLTQAHLTASGEASLFSLGLTEIVASAVSYANLAESYCRFIDTLYENVDHTAIDISAAEIVDHMETYFQNHFTSAISYKMFYDLFGFNETYLSHVFKLQRGISPNKYVTKLRIEKAKEMMQLQPETPLKKIAALVGYEDAFYFSRVFKETTGSSPSEFIKLSIPIKPPVK
ncbi:response regulator [Paenibacillus psychroresistens]|uniref:Response regulator n=1 Tax=Paenibacillus psychroresistens TaxID=1778678 RepID=A0A6B8RE78_9BACL|nr:response regulator [Paenibacillus psychroresistens]QGQ94470.1 response regulator [Paenibacillus psychroresistens]